MRVLVVSDTHDNMYVVGKLIEIINREKPDMVIHCGDYISPFMIRTLAKIKVKIVGVWGNNDGDKQTILNIISGTDFSIVPQPREIQIANLSTLIIHGWQSPEKTKRLVRGLARSGEYKLVIYGHTHKQDITIVSNGEIEELPIEKFEIGAEEFDTLIINPGEACGWLTDKRTFFLLSVDNRIIVEPREIPIE